MHLSSTVCWKSGHLSPSRHLEKTRHLQNDNTFIWRCTRPARCLIYDFLSLSSASFPHVRSCHPLTLCHCVLCSGVVPLISVSCSTVTYKARLVLIAGCSVLRGSTVVRRQRLWDAFMVIIFRWKKILKVTNWNWNHIHSAAFLVAEWMKRCRFNFFPHYQILKWFQKIFFILRKIFHHHTPHKLFSNRCQK